MTQRPVSSGPLTQSLTVVNVPVDAEVDLGAGYDNPSSFWNGQGLRPVILSPQPDGGAKIGWTDTDGKIHITPVDEQRKRCGVDMTIPRGLLRDLVAHDDGSAVLVLRDGGMFLYRLRGEETVFEERLASNWCREIHWGSLAWNGETYAAYFAVHRGGHEGDAFVYIDPNGDILPGGWSWGVSHSIDMRLALAGRRFMPLALSDAYPGTGLFFNHNRKRVSYVWGDFSGGTGGRIGGMVALRDRMFVAFSSKQGGRRNWGVALADFGQEEPHDQQVHKYLEDCDVDQVNVKIARYGDDQLLVSWLEDGRWNRKFQLYDANAQPVGSTEVLPVRASARSDLKTDGQGNVVWAHNWGDDHRVLQAVRISRP
ncbi:MAG: hypothetical protein KDA42_10810 [Planctomycetales bacterium]|nr:hypothetical protein [Planctomycetales bacterium]